MRSMVLLYPCVSSSRRQKQQQQQQQQRHRGRQQQQQQRRRLGKSVLLLVLAVVVVIQISIFSGEAFLNALSTLAMHHYYMATTTTTTTTNNKNKNNVTWEWIYYNQYYNDSNNKNDGNNNHDLMNHHQQQQQQQQQRVNYKNDTLVAQYTGISDENYALLLNITKRVNVAYAKRHGMDYVAVWGSILESTGLVGSATFNKPYIVEEAIRRGYTYLFLLDADALVWQMNRTVRDNGHVLVSRNRVLTAQKVNDDDTTTTTTTTKINNNNSDTYNINIGITIWNLKHARTEWLVKEWKEHLLNSPTIFSNSADDQYPLQKILKHELQRSKSSSSSIQSQSLQPLSLAVDLTSFVAHVMRSSVGSADWTFTNPGVQTRAAKLQTIVQQVCTTYSCE